MKRILFVTAVVAVILSACSSKKGEKSKKIDVPVQGTCNITGMNGKKIVFEELKDGKLLASDTAIIENNSFKADLGVDSTCVRVVSSADQAFKPFEVVLETGNKGNVTVKINSDSTIVVSGSPLNDLLQKRYEDNLVYIKDLYAARDEREAREAVLKRRLTEDENKEYGAKFKVLMDKETDNAIAFTKQNINNPLGKYYFIKTYFFLPSERKKEMMDFATDDIKAQYQMN